MFDDDIVLVVSVHPDDEILGCGGTIIRHRLKGDRVYVLYITGSKEIGESTLPLVCDSLRLTGYACLGLPDITLSDIPLSTIISKIKDYVDLVSPSILYLPCSSDVHSDHRIVYEACMPFAKSFRYPQVRKILSCYVPSETEYSSALFHSPFIPNYFVDITNQIDRKIEVMQLYKSEMMPEPYPRCLSTIKSYARVFGSRSGVMYAEAFQLLYEKV